MGATTWSYPKDEATIEEVLQIIAAPRSGFATAYGGYLTKAATFEKPPEVGECWPRDGYYHQRWKPSCASSSTEHLPIR